jgi:hypothetical protein
MEMEGRKQRTGTSLALTGEVATTLERLAEVEKAAEERRGVAEEPGGGRGGGRRREMSL